MLLKHVSTVQSLPEDFLGPTQGVFFGTALAILKQVTLPRALNLSTEWGITIFTPRVTLLPRRLLC